MIVGASGLLGKYLMREWTPPDQVVGFGSRDFDIRNLAQTQAAVEDRKPHWIVLAAAYTDVDGCETNPEVATDTNVHGALNVAAAAKAHHARLLFLSSDYVFDGCKTTPYEVDDPISPQSVYGKTKAEAELGIRKILPTACIVRTSWVFGRGGKCFPDTILKLASTRREIAVVDDQRGCPTYARDLARAIIRLCNKGAEGTIHVTNGGNCTWFEFARATLRHAGSTTSVVPTTTENFPRPAQRPKYSVLSAKSLAAHGMVLPAWGKALDDYLKEGNSLP